MPWNNCGELDPMKKCIACRYEGVNLELYKQIKGDSSLGDHYWQECGECGCVSKFYLDTKLDKYFCQIFKLVDLLAFDEQIRGTKNTVN